MSPTSTVGDHLPCCALSKFSFSYRRRRITGMMEKSGGFKINAKPYPIAQRNRNPPQDNPTSISSSTNTGLRQKSRRCWTNFKNYSILESSHISIHLHLYLYPGVFRLLRVGEAVGDILQRCRLVSTALPESSVAVFSPQIRCTFLGASVCVYIQMHVCIYMPMYMSVHIYMCVCMYTHTDIYIDVYIHMCYIDIDIHLQI